MSEKEDVISEFLVFPSTSEEEDHKWTHQNTLLFLDLYQKYRGQVGSLYIKNLKKMFEQIAKEMQHLTKTRISGSNCENKWKVLERNYKKYIDNSKLTGRGRKVFEYADVMHEILGKKKNIHPVLLLSTDTVHAPKSPETSAPDKENIEMEIVTEPNVQDTPKTETVVPTCIRKRQAVRNNTENKRLKVNILREIRNDRKEFYKKRLEIENQRLLEKKRKNDLLEKRNTLLENFVSTNGSTPIIDLGL